MRKILFPVLLCMMSLGVHAQQVSGKVVDEKGKPLGNASVQMIGGENTACVSDSKGFFSLDCGKNNGKQAVVRVSCIGFQPLDIAIDGNTEQMQLGTLKLIKDSYHLNEVTVTAAKQQVDRTLHYPSEKLKASANNGYELIHKMMLPGIVVNLADKSFSMLNKESVLLYINDKPATKADITALRPNDVIKVEFIDAPGAEYGFDTNVGSVIKFFVKRHDQGLILGFEGVNAVTTINGQNFVYAKYYKGLSQFSISASNTYTNIHRRNTNEYNEYHFGTEQVTAQRDGINTKLGYTNTDIDLNYNLTKAGKYILDLGVSGTIYDAPNRGNKQYVTETSTKPYYSFTKNTEHYFKPVINLFHKAYFGNHQTLTSNAVFTIIDTDYGYYLNEYDNEDTDVARNQYSYDTDGLKHSLILETKYMNKLGKTMWTSGARYAYSDVENKYKGYSDATDHMYDNNTYLYTQLSGSLWKDLSYMLGVGASYQYAKQGAQKTDNWVFRPKVILQLPIKKVNLRYSFQISPIAPSLGNLSATMQQANAYEFSQGNPELKMNSYFINSLTASASLGKLFLKNMVRYDYSRHPIMAEISIIEMDGKKAFLHSVANQKSYSDIYDNLAMQYELIPNLLSVQGSVTYHHYQTIADSYRHFLNDVNGMVQADLYVGKWSAGASWNSASKELAGESISKNSPYSSIYVNYQLGAFRIGLMANYLFQKNGITQTEKLINENLKKSLTLRVPSMGNMLMVNIAWNFQKGKLHKTVENSFSNSDSDSGILKF